MKKTIRRMLTVCGAAAMMLSAAQIIAFAEDIAAHPEPGFEEVRTAGKTAEFLKSLGYEVKEHLAITGVKAR